MEPKRNLLLIGASGGVAGAFLRKLVPDRARLRHLILVDSNDGLLRNPFVPHSELDYVFLKRAVDVRNNKTSYHRLLQDHCIHAVIDLSTNETRAMLEATDALGIHYINTGIVNRRGESFSEVVMDLIRRKADRWRVPHLLGTGMNPGIVNLWVRQAVERFGVPTDIVHFEYDTGQPVKGWLPIIPWSRETFLDEIVNDPAGYMDGRSKVRFLHPNPLKNRVAMTNILSPIMDLREYPRGFLVLHEENITLSQRYDTPSRFLLAVDPRTMDYLEKIYDEKQTVPLDAMTLGDNRRIPLRGSETVGVMLEYLNRRVYFFNQTSHRLLPGSSGSCWQVAAGLHAAIFTLFMTELPNRLHFMEDLYDTPCEGLVKENLRVQEMVIE